MYQCNILFYLFICINLSDAFIILKIRKSPENRLNVRSNEKELNSVKKYKGAHNNINKHYNKILVKRIIPHDLKPGGIEFIDRDHKYETYYKPLIRIHKRKDLSNNELENKIYFIVNKIPIINPINDKTDEKLLEPFKLGKKNKLLDNINAIQKNIKLKSQRLKTYDKVIRIIKNVLRMPQFEKSGETNDPWAPGKMAVQEEHGEPTEKKPTNWMPHYPPWNYWTYKKTIHQDECPTDQVKAGNVCIWTPPH